MMAAVSFMLVEVDFLCDALNFLWELHRAGTGRDDPNFLNENSVFVKPMQDRI